MVFNYYKYCQANLVRPLLAILLGVIGLAVYTVPQIVALVSNPLKYMHLVTPISGAGFLLLSFVFLLGYPFWNGGYHLLWEKPKDMICISGKITSISECSTFHGLHYDTDDGMSMGYKIMVNGVGYLAMSHARCCVGNHVMITVLPRSRIVLSIMKTDEQ